MSFSFGSTAAAAPAASSGFGFGGGAAPATGTSSGFSFGGGAAAAPATSTAGSGFSFGATPSTAATGSTGFSFGGGAPTTSMTPATSTGGFGFGSTPSAAPATSSGFGFGATSAPASGSLFGSTGTTAPTSSSLFGGASPSTAGSSLFGGSGSTGSSLFGGGATTGSSVFGAPGTATPSAFGSGLGFGAQQQPAQPQPAITLETVFDTLPADVKKNITDFHQFLKEEDQSDAFLKTVSKGKLSDLDANLEQLEQDVLLRRNLQDRQATSVHNVRKDVKHLIHQVDTATLNLRSMSGESTSQRFYGIMRRVEMPSAYYWQLLTSFEERMEQIKTQIESVESEFQPLYEKHRRGESSLSQTVDPAMLQQILLSQNAALMQVAAHVAEVHERTEEMRQAFIRKMKEDLIKHGDKNLTTFKNPFDKKKKNASRESDIDTIRFKTSVAPTIVATQQAPQVQQPATTGFGFGTAAPAATGTTSLFAPTTLSTGTSSFGTSTPAASTTSLFAPTVSTGATPTTTTSTGFGFGGGLGSTAPAPITAPKQVSFNLGGTATPTGTTSNPGSMAFGFSLAPATPSAGASTGGFGSTTASFLGASAGDKRGSTATSGAKTLRARQKKR